MRPRLRLTALAAFLLLPALVAARGQQERLLGGWALDDDGSIRIHNHNGTVRVIAWARDSVAVRGTIAAGASFFGGGTRRGLKCGVETSAGVTGGSSDIVVQVPRWASVVVRGAATDVTLEGLAGSVDASTVTGKIFVSAGPRQLIAETMEGSLVIVGSPGILRAKTASGRLRWTGTATDAVVGSVSGRVEVSSGPLGQARIETITGDVVFDATLEPDADITIESHAGAIEFHLRGDVPAFLRVDAASIGGEGIATTSGFTKAGKREAPRLIPVAGAREGAPAASVTVRSFKGTFRLLPPGPPTPIAPR